MAPSRSTPQMMQVTRAAFQAVASLNEQATDPKSHTPVKNVYTSGSLVPLPANSDGRPKPLSSHSRAIGDSWHRRFFGLFLLRFLCDRLRNLYDLACTSK